MAKKKIDPGTQGRGKIFIRSIDLTELGINKVPIVRKCPVVKSPATLFMMKKNCFNNLISNVACPKLETLSKVWTFTCPVKILIFEREKCFANISNVLLVLKLF